MAKLNKPLEKLLAKTEEVVNTYEAKTPTLLESDEEMLQEAAVTLEGWKRHKIKDYEFLMSHYKDKQLDFFKSKESVKDKTELHLYENCVRILEKAKEIRRERNRETNKVDTNILSHAPFFVGGSRKRKEIAASRRKISLDKDGLRKLSYHNDMGALLSMFDAKTLFTLFSLWEEQGKGKYCEFSEYQLVERMNLSQGGKQYEYLRNSLEKLKSTKLVLQEYFDKGEDVTLLTKEFQLIYATTTKTVQNKASGKQQTQKIAIEFSDYIRNSFNNGYYSLVSFAVLDELDSSAAAQSLYLAMCSEQENQNYRIDERAYEFPLERLYQHMLLERINRQNKATIVKACEELKHAEIIIRFQLLGEGNSADTIRIEPSPWFKEILGEPQQKLPSL